MRICYRMMLAGLLLLTALAPAYAGVSTQHTQGVHLWVIHVLTLVALAGAVTVTYKYPVQGTVAPTTSQVKNLASVEGKIEWADADTIATITHNFQMGTVALPNGGSLVQESTCGFPIMIMYASAVGSAAALLSASATVSSITSQVTKTSLVGSGGTIEFSVQRPAQIIR